ncbi:ankyrin-3 isoform X2 [Condylostylus longicornis]|uniref:ankyrin-3 isoform X2 n=1 Tax=Condylostylus longicornis TaxID=2530218 RepID=UPI00244DED89|nr:ankyrin-3 isoform X2 [Condylostylus longicornis]
MALGESQNGTVTNASNNKHSEKNDKIEMQNDNQHHNKGGGHEKKTTKQADANISFLRAARSGDFEKVIEFLESGQVTDLNTCNANGLNALHLAAKDGYVDIVNDLLKRGANVDNATKKGNTALHIASLAGQKDVIKLLIQYGANVNVQSLNGFTPLYMAAQENHDACVRYLLAKGANPSLATEDGFTPLAVAMQQGHDKVVAVLLESDSRGKVRLPALHIAAKKDDVKAAALLLENEHNPDIVSKSGFTPLHIAAHYGNVDIANLLIDKGADVNYTAKHNITPLHVACKWGKTNIINLLLSKGAKIDATTRDGLTPLHCAARSGHEKVIEILLKNNAPILSKTKNGLAPLHMAAQGEHDEAARILLQNMAPVDEVTVDYLTALHVAAHCGHVKVAKLLLDHQADPNARALNGFTPLHIACKKNRIKVVELLLKHNASISATTESGLTPLHVASFMGCMNIVIYLLQHDAANPDAPTVRGETPLHLAARAKQTDIIRILLRNGAQVDVKAREGQTPLHVASRLGNIDIVMLLLQHGANVDSKTKDLYTPLHITAKEGQEEVASVLLENNANIDATTKKGFSPLHLAAKYGNVNVAQLLLQKGAQVDTQGKNGVTPLHVANHYDHQNVALMLLEKGASPHTMAKNGHTALHIAAKKNQMDIANALLQYGANTNAESKSGFTPLHLAAQEGHVDMVNLLLEHDGNSNSQAKNGLTPMHLAAQEDKTDVGRILLDNNAKIDERTKAGYTPLHVAAHFGQVNMVKFLLENDANIEMSTNIGYTPLHQAAQQGHTLIINLLLRHKANPNALTNNGQTALSIANKLGYVTAVETLKIVTETSIINTVTGALEEKYKVVAPESMHETFMSDSEDEGGEDHIDHHNQYKYMVTDGIMADTIKFDTTDDDDHKKVINETITSQYVNTDLMSNPYIIKATDNVNIVRPPIHVGFLVSFLVDARGGAMRGCRHSGVRVIVPTKSCAQPTRITCRYVKPPRISNPPPLMEGEALVSRILELSPVEAKFLGPVIIEVPHFGSLRDKEREIVILRSDNGETWREHTLIANHTNDDTVRDVLNEIEQTGDALNPLEDLHTNRIIRIVTHDFPHFFAVISRIRQEVHAIGPDGGTVSSVAVPQVQAIFPEHALTKKIRVGLQAQPVDLNGCAKLLGQGVAVSPVVTVEPRRRKFHKAITLSIPAPRTHAQGMVNQYSGNAPTLRLLCSITGGQNRAVWEDVTGSTPLTFVKDSVSFTTTVSARFWLMDCRNIADASRMATELYTYMTKVPFMVKFVVFAKRISNTEAKLSIFCMTDDKEDKTLEQQEYFSEIAKSRDVEVLEEQQIYLEFSGNLVPIAKSGEQLHMKFQAFRENRLSFMVRVKNEEEPFGRVSFMNEPKVAKGEPPQVPICNLNVSLVDERIIENCHSLNASQRSLDRNYCIILNGGLTQNQDEIHKADIRLSDICNLLGDDWMKLAKELNIPQSDIDLIELEYPDKPTQQAMVMLRLWLRSNQHPSSGNLMRQALQKIKRPDIVDKCIFNLELVTDDMEKAVAKMQLDQSGFNNLQEECETSHIIDTSVLNRTKDNNTNVNNVGQKLNNIGNNDNVNITQLIHIQPVQEEDITIAASPKQRDRPKFPQKQLQEELQPQQELEQQQNHQYYVDHVQIKEYPPSAPEISELSSQKKEVKLVIDESPISKIDQVPEIFTEERKKIIIIEPDVYEEQKPIEIEKSIIGTQLDKDIIKENLDTILQNSANIVEEIKKDQPNRKSDYSVPPPTPIEKTISSKQATISPNFFANQEIAENVQKYDNNDIPEDMKIMPHGIETTTVETDTKTEDGVTTKTTTVITRTENAPITQTFIIQNPEDELLQALTTKLEKLDLSNINPELIQALTKSEKVDISDVNVDLPELSSSIAPKMQNVNLSDIESNVISTIAGNINSSSSPNGSETLTSRTITTTRSTTLPDGEIKTTIETVQVIGSELDDDKNIENLIQQQIQHRDHHHQQENQQQ